MQMLIHTFQTVEVHSGTSTRVTCQSDSDIFEALRLTFEYQKLPFREEPHHRCSTSAGVQLCDWFALASLTSNFADQRSRSNVNTSRKQSSRYLFLLCMQSSIAN